MSLNSMRPEEAVQEEQSMTWLQWLSIMGLDWEVDTTLPMPLMEDVGTTLTIRTCLSVKTRLSPTHMPTSSFTFDVNSTCFPLLLIRTMILHTFTYTHSLVNPSSFSHSFVYFTFFSLI